MLNFLPKFPLHIEPFGLFGLILLAGLIAGEIVGRNRFLPKILGYIMVGFLIGPGGFNWVSEYLLQDTHIFVDISLALILFELGRHLDFTWLRHDRSILSMAAAESGFTFGLILILLVLLGFPLLLSTLVATIAIATSPAVVMMVAHDLSAQGPVTRRALILTSLNNLFALVIFSILLPLTQIQTSFDLAILLHILYRLFGSLLFGLGTFALTLAIAYLTGKRREGQFILFISAVVLAANFSHALHLSTMLSLFWFGVAARNLDRKHILMEVDFGWLARLFFILLFVVIGIHLQLHGLWQATLAVLAFLAVRLFTKLSGVWLFAKESRLTRQQAWAISLALSPMAGVAISMTNTLTRFNPELGHLLITTIAAAVAVLNILGPIATQFAFIKAGEALTDQNKKV